jgi:hypothetical protein
VDQHGLRLLVQRLDGDDALERLQRRIASSARGSRIRPSSRLTVPAGACVRTEIAVTAFASPHIGSRRPSLPVSIRCLTAPGARCRVDVRAYEFGSGDRIGRLRATVPRGARRLLRVALGGRVADRIRRSRKNPTFFIIRTIDPDGRTARVGPI